MRLQPLFPSLPVGFTYSCVVPFGTPTFSGMTSATASIELSKLLEMSSARATAVTSAAAMIVPKIRLQSPLLRICACVAKFASFLIFR